MTQPSEIVAVLAPVVDVLEQLGVPYHVGGSVAALAHGVPRATADVDLVADLRLEHVSPFVSRLQAAYYVDAEAVREAIDQRRSFNLIHLATMLKVDVFVPAARAFDGQEARRAEPRSLEVAEGARQFFVKSPEDLVLRKLEWFQSGGGVSERQWNDVVGLLRVQHGRLDRRYLEQWAARLALTDLLRRALEDADEG